MNLRAQWILSESELGELARIRQEKYLKYQDQQVQDRDMTRSHLSSFIKFMRKRKRQPEMPLKFEKVIYYAVALYRRYYLLKTYIQEEPTLSILCALYTSFKLNEYQQGFIKSVATKWKEKPEFEPAKRLPHYGEEGYTEAELKFLQGIHFQTAISKLIQPAEALYSEVVTRLSRERGQAPHTQEAQNNERVVPAALHRVESHLDKTGQQIKYVLFALLEQLEKVYLHPTLIFLFQGPKIALAILVQVLRKKDLPRSLLGPEMEALSIKKQAEIDHILDVLSLQEVGHHQDADISKTKLANFKIPEPKKPSQSPPFRPRNEHPHDFS